MDHVRGGDNILVSGEGGDDLLTCASYPCVVTDAILTMHLSCMIIGV